jgi:DNA-binding SARP family transcriptional activator
VLRFRVLGELVVSADDTPVPLTRAKQRTLLGALLLRAGTPVSADQLAEALWGEAQPASARDLVRVYVSQIREALGDHVVETRAGGYAVPADVELDAATFRAHLDDARSSLAAGATVRALSEYDSALGLWRGPVLADAPVEGEARIDCRLLEDLRLAAVEERFEVALAVGPARELVAELEAAVAAEPARERLRGLLILALYRSGRQADALAAYRETRRHLSEEFGIEPGPDLRELERRILRQDPTLFGSKPAPAPLVHRRKGLLLVLACAALAGMAALFLGLSVSGKTVIRGQSLAALEAETGRPLADVRLSAPVTAVSTGDGLVLAGTDARTIAEIDPARTQIVRTVGVATVPHALAFAGGAIWVANGFDGTLTRVGLDGFESPTTRPEPQARGRLTLAGSGDSLWVGSQDNRLTRLASDGTVVASARVVQPEAATVAFHALWVAQATRVTVQRGDSRTGRTQRFVPVGTPCTSVAAGTGSVWALSPSSATVWRIDPATDAVTAAIRVDPGATQVVAGARAVWVVTAPLGELQRIDPRRNILAGTVRLGHPIGGAVVVGDKMWVGLR